MEPAKPPRRILSIDGGGLRGVAAIAFLQRLEKKLAEDYGRPVRLHEHFDLIGGSSTGAIIAAGLALGLSLDNLLHRYFQLAPNVFKRAWHRIPFVHSIFDARALNRQFIDVVGDRRLDSADLKTGLAIVTKRIDTGSVWFLSNNHKSAYWEDAPDGSYFGNRAFSLANLIRASTAAPHYFDPQVIELGPASQSGVFIDGGVSPYNNPCLALLLLATLPQYGYGWKTGAAHLDMTSIGTGSFRHRIGRTRGLERLSAIFAIDALRSIISDNEAKVLTLMQVLGRCETPWRLNSEITQLGEFCIAPEPLFTFRRYDIVLEREALLPSFPQGLSAKEVKRLQDMTRGSSMQVIYELASRAAQAQIPILADG